MRPFLRLLTNLLRIVLGPLWWLLHWLQRPKGGWVYLRIRPALVELAEELPWWRRLGRASSRLRSTSLADVRRLFDRIGRERSLRGCVLEVRSLHAGWSSCFALRAAILALRERGKQVCVYLPFGGGNRELLVALAADRVLVAPEASLSPLGIAARVTYLGPLLQRLGLQVEVHAEGAYKTAADRFTRDRMSDADREQLGTLIDVLQSELAASVRLRGLDEAAVARVFAKGMMHGEQAVQLRLADGACYPDELPQALGLAGSEAKRPWVGGRALLRWADDQWLRPIHEPDYVAVVPVHGAIALQETTWGKLAGVDAVVARLRQARRDRKARGVILHLDSPGGSALASDLIHREVAALAARKPVVAFMGEVAASGGYYLAAAAGVIVAQPTTVTGSIGVISARLLAAGLLERLQVRVETLRAAPHADLFSPARPATEAEMALIAEQASMMYRRFVQVVAQGRNLSESEVHALGQGRVWSGRDARRHGLVDRLGGFEAAMDEVRARLPQLSLRQRNRLEPRVVRVHRSESYIPGAARAGEGGNAAAGVITDSLDWGRVLWSLARKEPILYCAPQLWRVE